ncbi:hypothetical protein [Kiloniella sp. b19]|uniref:hypothetical protein n=1 Tax=Kiloniella sp. GXU_MW_B19 TaxID=3141326 RepID=UPI0031D5712A
MFSFIGRLLGSDKALSSVVDGVSNGLDALVYTDEEKAGDAAAERKAARAMVVDWMRATQGQNIARRLIALSITGVWLAMYLVSAGAGMIAVFLTDGQNLKTLSDLARNNADDMSGPVMLILSFYFAAPHMGDLAKGVLAKWQNKGAVTGKGA